MTHPTDTASLVARLRDLANTCETGTRMETMPMIYDPSRDILREAADEITRLTERLEKAEAVCVHAQKIPLYGYNICDCEGSAIRTCDTCRFHDDLAAYRAHLESEGKG